MKYLYLPLFAIFLAVGCVKKYPQPDFNPKQRPDLPPVHITGACAADSVPLTNASGTHYGWIIAYADSVNLTVTIRGINDWLIEESHLYVGPCENIPSVHTGLPLPDNFLNHTYPSQPANSTTYIIPLAEADSCFCIVAYAELVFFDPCTCEYFYANAWGGNIQAYDCGEWYAIWEYCLPPCACGPVHDPDPIDPDTCEIVIGEFRTQKQGEWGDTPNGNNFGTYLQSNFAGAFPSGITIGCTFTITLTTAQAVTDFLPQSGPATALTQNYTDPAQNITVLAGEVLALTLNVEFDKYDPAFAPSSTGLEDLIIVSGVMAGQTVGYALNQGNLALGGCTASYSIGDIKTVLKEINKNFHDATKDYGYLECP